jgi:hypothetical protein
LSAQSSGPENRIETYVTDHQNQSGTSLQNSHADLDSCGASARSCSIDAMRFKTVLLAAILASGAATSVRAQAPGHPASKPEADRLGLSCAQVLKMTSGDWSAYYARKTGPVAANTPNDILSANAVYGKCYDARTDALAASLAAAGKGPSKAARAEFLAFEADLKDFESKALSDTKPANDSRRKSYADLYEKQFRYGFYQEYESKATKTARAAAAALKAAPATAAPKSAAGAAPAGPTSSAAPAGGGSSTPHEPTTEEQARSNADPVTQAKNRFGKILEELPDDQMHEIHSAFSEVIGAHAIGESTRLAVYRYAIDLLEFEHPTSSEPPPF